MRAHLEKSEPTSCLNRAKDDEMVFVLLGRDPAAPVAIRAWISARIKYNKNRPGDLQLTDAEKCASAMEAERVLLLEIAKIRDAIRSPRRRK